MQLSLNPQPHVQATVRIDVALYQHPQLHAPSCVRATLATSAGLRSEQELWLAAPAESPCCVDVQEPMTIVLPQTDMTPHSAATRRGSHRLRVQIRAAAATPGGGWSSDGVGSLDADVLATEAVVRAGWRHVSLSHWWCWMTTLVGASEHGVKKPRYRRLHRPQSLRHRWVWLRPLPAATHVHRHAKG